jgi:hypothetical protein
MEKLAPCRAAGKLASGGSPATVLEQIKSSAAGVFNTVLGEFNFGAMAGEDVIRSIRLFATAIIPALQNFGPCWMEG